MTLMKFKDIWLALGIRLFAFVFSSLASLVTARMLFSNGGIDSYALSNLFATLFLFSPLFVFGTSAAFTNFIASTSNYKSDLEVANKFLTSFRVLTFTGLAICISVVVIWIFDSWEFILGPKITVNFDLKIAMTICIALIGIGLPFSLANSILVGSYKNYLAILSLSAAGPVSFVWVWITSAYKMPLEIQAIGPNVGYFVSLTVSWFIVRAKQIYSFNVAKRFFYFRKYPGSSIRSTSAPLGFMLTILTVTIQADRIILSHNSTLTEVAYYSMMAQLLSPVLSVMGVVTTSFWPHLVKRRVDGERDRGFLFKSILLVILCSLSLIFAMRCLAPFFIDFVFNSELNFKEGLFWLFSLVVILQIIHSIISYSMTSDADLKYQLKCIAFMAPINITMSYFLSKTFGAYGPLLGTAISLPLVVILPNVLRFLSYTRT